MLGQDIPNQDDQAVLEQFRANLKDVYTLYESGKGRRYNLLFSVNGAAFAIVAFLVKDTGAFRDAAPGGFVGAAVLLIAAMMILFTLIMWVDIHSFGKKMAGLGPPLKLFGPGGKLVLAALATLLIVAWLLLAFLGDRLWLQPPPPPPPAEAS